MGTDDNDEEDPGDPGPLSPAEVVSELLYAGKSLREVAGYDDEMLVGVVFRRRDRYGRLVRVLEGLPPGVEVDEEGMRVVMDPRPFSAMYRQVRLSQGMSREEAEDDWLLYKAANPALGVGGPR